MREITIGANDGGQRLDRFLKKYLCNASLSYIYKAIRKDVKLNGRRAKEETLLAEGDVLSLYIMDSELERLTRRKAAPAAKRQFAVCCEDANILAVSKPYGLLVHGDKTEKKDTLSNQVISYLIEKGDYVPRAEKSFVPSPVHRLDRNTTGLVVFGKNAAALRILSSAFAAQDGRVTKYYLTLCKGEMKETLHLKGWLLKDERTNKVRVLSEASEKGRAEGKYIETIARPVHAANGHTLAEIELVTGRSHQIRAHLQSAGFPLMGDTKYGGGKDLGLSTQLLHARRIVFGEMPQPLDGLQGLEIQAPLPKAWGDIQRKIFGEEIVL